MWPCDKKLWQIFLLWQGKCEPHFLCESLKCDTLSRDTLKCDTLTCDTLKCVTLKCDTLKSNNITSETLKLDHLWRKPDIYVLIGQIMETVLHFKESLTHEEK